MFSEASVCLSFCLFVSQRDSFRTIKHKMMKLGGQVQWKKSRPSSNWGSKVKDQGHQGQKRKKVRHFWEPSSGARVVSSASSTPVGKSAHAV